MMTMINHKIGIFLLLTTAAVAQIQSNGNGEEVPPPIEAKTSLADFETDKAILNKFASDRDLSMDTFHRLVGPLVEKRLKDSSPQSLEFILTTCQILLSGRFSMDENPQAKALVYNYANQVLEKQKVSATIEASLVTSMLVQQLTDLRDSTPDTLPKLRREAAEKWIHALESIEREIDPNFDTDDPRNMAVLTVPYPKGVQVGVFGAAPSAIKDPELRRQYKEAIAENARKARKNWDQRQLKDLHTRFSRIAQRYLVDTYSRQPENREELNSFLRRIKNQSFKQKVLDELQKIKVGAER